MGSQFSLQELSIVVLGQNHNPTILNPDFLKHNDIVPYDWELQTPPLCIEPMAQVEFKNKIKIIAQLDKIVFSENVAGKDNQEILIPEIVYKYTKTLPHVEYFAVGINPKGHIAIGSNKESCQKYVTETFITPGPWKNFGDSPVKVNIRFAYTVGETLCNLSIEEKAFKASEDKQIQVIVFAGNLHHTLVGNDRRYRLQDLHKIIKEWKKDLNLYQELIDKILLAERD